MKKLKILLCLPFVFALQGCDDPLEDIKGAYNGSVAVTTASGVDQFSAIAETIRDPKGHLVIRLFDASTFKLKYSVGLSSSDKNLFVASDFLPTLDTHRLDYQGKCAIKQIAGELSIQACVTKDILNFVMDDRLQERRLSVYVSKDAGTPLEEQGEPLPSASRSAIVERVKSFNFETALEAERVYQAKREIDVARGALLPNLSINPVLNAIELDLGLGDILSSVIPFVFPSRWYELDRAKYQFEAEKYSYISLLANQIEAASTLYFDMVRDQLLKSRLQELSHTITDIRDQAVQNVRLGSMLPSEKGNLDSQVSLISDDVAQLEDLQRQRQASIARMLNLKTNLVPLEWQVDLRVSVSQQGYLDSWITDSLANSPELKQWIHLAEAARKSSQTMKWTFLDPQGDPRGNLGFGYTAQLDINRSSEQMIQIRRKEVERRIEEEVRKVASGIQRWTEAKASLEAARSRANNALNAEKQTLRLGGKLEVSRLIGLFRDVVELEIRISVLEVSISAADDKLNRLLLTNDYGNLQGEVPERNTSNRSGD